MGLFSKKTSITFSSDEIENQKIKLISLLQLKDVDQLKQLQELSKQLNILKELKHLESMVNLQDNNSDYDSVISFKTISATHNRDNVEVSFRNGVVDLKIYKQM